MVYWGEGYRVLHMHSPQAEDIASVGVDPDDKVPHFTLGLQSSHTVLPAHVAPVPLVVLKLIGIVVLKEFILALTSPEIVSCKKDFSRPLIL